VTGIEGLVGRQHARATASAALDAAADRTGDAARAVRATAERDRLAGELAAAARWGGRTRTLGDEGERARKAVTARIRNAVARIDQVHPLLGAHLRASVRTGLWCRYADTATRWTAEPVGAGDR
jgi:hypothetical protein